MKKTILMTLLGLGFASAGLAADAEPSDLKTIMVGLGNEMSQLQAALWVEDLEAVGAAARRIVEHPKVTPEERTRVQAALGEDFPDFVAGDRTVHDAAVRLAEAAEGGDIDQTVVALGELQAGCVSCHTRFRAPLRVE